MQSVSVYIDIAKVTDFWRKKDDFNRTHGVFHVIHIFLRSFLGNV